MIAWSPVVTWPTWELSTVAFTMYEPVETTTTCADVELGIELDDGTTGPRRGARPRRGAGPRSRAGSGRRPVRAVPVPADEALPVTCWPTVR